MKTGPAKIQPDSIQQIEKKWHEEFFHSRRTAKFEFVVPMEIRDRYLQPPKRPLFHYEELFRLAGDVRGKNVLVFGCGDDNSTVIFALKGANVWAFDISEEAIKAQRQMAIANGVADRVHTEVCAAEEMSFREHQFDLVFGSAILHHIPDYLPVLPGRLHHILKKDGLAVFAEPVIRSAALKTLLDALPWHDKVSPGERQLLDTDFDHFRNYFDLSFSYFTLLSRLNRFLLRGPLEHAPLSRKTLVYGLHSFDYVVLNVLGLKRLAGIAVVAMRPKAG